MTDIARYKSDDPTAVIQNWLRNRDVIEFLNYWKDFITQILNPSNSRGLENRQDVMVEDNKGGSIIVGSEIDPVVRTFRTTASDGKNYNIIHYNLDMIISLRYRVFL